MMKPELFLNFPAFRAHDFGQELFFLSESKGPIHVTGEIDGKKIDYKILLEENRDALRGVYAGEEIDFRESGKGYVDVGRGMRVDLELRDSRFKDQGRDFVGAVDGKAAKNFVCVVPREEIDAVLAEPLDPHWPDGAMARFRLKWGIHEDPITRAENAGTIEETVKAFVEARLFPTQLLENSPR